MNLAAKEIIAPLPADDGLPEGWAQTRLGEAFQLNPPKPSAAQLSADSPVSFVPMPAVDAKAGVIAIPMQRPFGEVRSGFTSFANGDVIMAKITPCMENGKAAIARDLVNGLGFGSTEFHVLRSNGTALPEYGYYFIRQAAFRSLAESEMTGSVGQKRVPADFLRQAMFPLPSLAEQHRIVAKLEQLLAAASTTRARLARVPILLKRFRQSVLAAACSGRLTADWREQNPDMEPAAKFLERILIERRAKWEAEGRKGKYQEPVAPETSELPELPEEWTWASLDQFCLISSGDAFKKSDYAEHGIRLLQIANVGFGKTTWEQRNYLPGKFSSSHKNLMLSEEDIVLALNRPILGDRLKVAFLTGDDLPAILYQRVGRIKVMKAVSQSYVFYFALSKSMFDQVTERLQGTDQPYLNTSLVPGITLPMPPINEQREIVRRVERLLHLADAIEKRTAAASHRADRLTQAILAKAFRGELVPTEAELARTEGRDYESASVLLKRAQEDQKADQGLNPKQPKNSKSTKLKEAR